MEKEQDAFIVLRKLDMKLLRSDLLEKVLEVSNYLKAMFDYRIMYLNSK